MFNASLLWDDAGLGFATEVAVKAAIVLVAAAAVTAGMRSASAAWRHRAWSLAFAGVLLIPAFQFVLPGWRWQVFPQRPNQVLSSSTDAIVAESVGSSPSGSAETHRSISAPDSVNRPPTRNYGRSAADGERPAPSVAKPSAAVHLAAPPVVSTARSDGRWLVGIWAAGLAATLAPLAAGVVGNARLKRRARPLSDAAIERRVAALCRRIGLSQRPALLMGDERQMPMTFGLRRPVVVVPAGVTQWSDERFSSVVLHEFAHIKRGDVLWQLAARIACGIHWFNPLAWWALERMRHDRELSCDDCVLSAGQNSANYASELLNIAREHATRFPPMCAALTMARHSQLEGRILAVLDTDRRRTPAGVFHTAALAVAACALVAGLSGVHPANRAAADQVVGPKADSATSASSGDTPATAAATQQDNITGTWTLSIHYTGGDDRSADVPKRVSGPAKGNDVSSSAPATKNAGKWTTAHFISFRVTDPPPDNLRFTLQQEGEKVAGTYFAPRGRQKVSGAVKGKDVSFSVAVTNKSGERITGRFTGEVLSSGKMEGTVTYDFTSFFDVTESRLGPAKSKGEFVK